MPPALTHEKCMKEMCCACGRRAGKNKVTAIIGDRIRKWAQPSWSTEVVSHPQGICEACRVTLQLFEKQQTTDIQSKAWVVQR